MSFKFNFTSRSDDNAEDAQSQSDVRLEPAVEILLKNEPLQDDVAEAALQELTLADGTRMYYVLSQLVEQRIMEADSKLLHVLEGKTDLLPNVYEGGLKVWECSIDLVHHLTSIDIAFQGLKVLELGCGAGLPGLYTYIKGANTHFQDYNREVIDYLTIPNVRQNSLTEEQEEPNESNPQAPKPNTTPLDPKACRFFAGDWGLIKDLLLSEIKTTADKYDMILTSETIYCAENYRKIHETMQSLLKPQGVVYLSTKTYYFGVGGGIREFETKVKEWGVFDIQSCRQFTEGVQREIMELRFKEQV